MVQTLKKVDNLGTINNSNNFLSALSKEGEREGEGYGVVCEIGGGRGEGDTR